MKVRLLKHQTTFLQSPNKYTLLLGGIGSGKTFIGAHYALQRAIQFPNATGGIFANTFRQLQNATLKALFTLLDTVGLDWNYNQNKGILTINKTDIICNSLDNYDALRGIEIGWAWMDECAYAKREAFEMLIGRLRDNNGPLEMRLTTTPKGFNWVYDYWVGDNSSPSHHLINAASKDNRFLPDGYIDSLKQQYDEKLLAQELGGEFINITQGRIYYSFSRDSNVKLTMRAPQFPVMVGMDFNINPMTAIIANVTRDSIHVFDELYLQTSNTHEMAKYIKEKYGAGHKIIPDSTGKAIKTSSAGLSDHAILKQAGFIIPHVQNPFRMDRYNVVNNLLEKGRITIDPKCKNLIRDLEQVSFKEGSNLPDTSDAGLTHISDALGYLAWYSFPLVQRKIGVQRYA